MATTSEPTIYDRLVGRSGGSIDPELRRVHEQHQATVAELRAKPWLPQEIAKHVEAAELNTRAKRDAIQQRMKKDAVAPIDREEARIRAIARGQSLTLDPVKDEQQHRRDALMMSRAMAIVSTVAIIDDPSAIA